MIAASGPDGVSGFMKAAFGLRATFLAAFFGAAFFAAFFGAAFFAVAFFAVFLAAFLAGAFLAAFFAFFVAIKFSSNGLANHSDSVLDRIGAKSALVA
jgi:hypothetical protein